MWHPALRPSDRFSLLAVIDPDAYTAQTLTTGWIDVSTYGSILAAIFNGDLGPNATVDAKIRQATSAAGAGAKDVTGAAITQFTEAGTDSNKQAFINLATEDLDTNNGFYFVQLSVTIATATSDFFACLLGFDRNFGAEHVASVDEAVGGRATSGMV
jgi:hypothetical protein